jgi:hypothetical protein
MHAFCCGAYVTSWHVCDIARSRMEFRFRWKNGLAPDIAAAPELTPHAVFGSIHGTCLWESLTARWKRGMIPPLHE